MSEISHRRIRTNGIWMHVAEKGKGPLVLLIHGFPQLWSSWLHQIHHLADHGYRVVAPDMRGYGDTDSPPDAASYAVFHLVADLVGLLDQLGEEQAFVVGHDWGAQVAWHLCLLRPDRVRALVNLGVPYRARAPDSPPVESITKMLGEGCYISQFQEPGRAEASFARHDCLTVLKKFLLIGAPENLTAPPGVEIIDFLEAPSSLPPWITEEELRYSAGMFEKTGFTGALNYYRAMNLTWELMAPWQGTKITTPTKFILGDKDLGFRSFGTEHYVKGEEFKSLVPNLEVVVIDGHHFIQQESAARVTQEISTFFGTKLSSSL
uniref:soluble epoxide hydrolase n=1 Tax=Kalanchoe fedtschenkoi TaxID=63787 RepID=A0A7N0ZQU3_KALFE